MKRKYSMHYHFKVHKEDDGFWAECIEIPTCVTQGESKEELFQNMQEAINLCLEEPVDSIYLAPLPKHTIKCTSSIVEIPVAPEIAFGFLVRYQRIRHKLTQQQAAEQLGMKNIFSYQRLERRCNATLEMISKLLTLFPKLPINQVFA